MAAETPKIPKRGWARTHLALLLIVLAVVAAAASGATYYFVYQSAQRTFTIIGPWTGTEQDKFLPVLQAFTNQTGITVSYSAQREEDLATLLPTQFAAHRTPGDVIFMPDSFIRHMASQGNAMDVTTLVNQTDYASGALNTLIVDGKLYGDIYTGKVKPGFWYRISFFSAHGLTVPSTWNDFVNLLTTIKGIPGVQNPIVSGDGVGWPLSDLTEHFIATYGGYQMHQGLTNMTLLWNATSVQQALSSTLIPLLQAHDFGQPLTWDQTALQDWWSGQYALYFMGSWITGMVDNATDLGVFSLPAQQGVSPGIVFAADHFFIPTFSPHLSQAEELFKFLASDKAQTVQVKQGGHIATALGVPLNAYPAVDAKSAELIAGKVVLPDLDDTIGGQFQQTFWSQLKGLWTSSDPSSSLGSFLTAMTNAELQAKTQ